MPTINYIEPSGERKIIDGEEGATVMHTALDHGVDGIVGECGGSAMCATCHVYVEQEWLEKLPAMGPTEDAMLASTSSTRQANSRLSCQITLTEDLDGLTVVIPETQM